MIALAAAAAHAGLPYTPASTPFDNALARVQLSAGPPDVVTPPHVHRTNRVMIYFEPGTNVIRFQDGRVRPEHFKAGDAQWNDAMGTHTATIKAAQPVDIVHVELKSPPGMTPTLGYSARDALAVDPRHFKLEMDNNQVRVLRLRLGAGEKTVPHEEVFERLVVPITTARLKTAEGEAVGWRPGEVQWRMPGLEADANMAGAAYEAVIVEFKK
jgi:hypothetical protein